MSFDMRLFYRKLTAYVEISRGKKRSLNTKDKREAERLFRVMQREALRGRLIQLDENKRITLEEFRQDYLKGRRELSGDTRRMDDLALRSLAGVIGSGTTIRAINERKLAEFIRITGLRTTKTTVNTYLRHIRAALNTAAELGYCKAPKIKYLRTGRHLPRIITEKEILALLAAAQSADPELFRIVKFALWTATRRKEIIKLTWQNVRGDSATIRGKGDNDRTIPLLPEAREAMGPEKDIGPVFIQWHLDTVSKRFKQLCRDCKIEDVHFHNLRHTAATQMIRSGIPAPAVQAMLGHADYRTTEIYINIVKEALKQQMARLKY